MTGPTGRVPLPLPVAPPLPAGPADPGPGHPGTRTTAVSCPSPALCAVVDNTGHTDTRRDGTWLAPQSFGTTVGFGAAATTVALYQGGRVGVSCPTTTSCTAVVGTSVLDWNGSGWSAEAAPWASALAPGAAVPVSIACPTVTLCAIVNGDAIVVRNAGKPWTPRQTLDPGRQLDAISCPTRSFCVAADDTGAVMVWNGSTWTGPQQVIPGRHRVPRHRGVGVLSVAAVLHGHERRRRLRHLQRPRPGGPLTGPRRGRAQPAPTSSPVMPASMVTVRQLRVVAAPPVARSK